VSRKENNSFCAGPTKLKFMVNQVGYVNMFKPVYCWAYCKGHLLKQWASWSSH